MAAAEQRCSAAQAFDILGCASQNRNIKLRERWRAVACCRLTSAASLVEAGRLLPGPGSTPRWLAASRLGQAGDPADSVHRQGQWLPGLQGHRLTVVADLDRQPCRQRVGRSSGGDLGVKLLATRADREGKARDGRWQPGRECQSAVLAAPASKAGHGGGPRSGQEG
jgi:hypothetical protein